MLRCGQRCLTATTGAIGIAVIRAGDREKQNCSLHCLLRDHDERVAANSQRTTIMRSTYDVESALYYDAYNVAVLPSVSGGAARQPLRTKLLETGAVAGVQERLLAPWQAEGERRVVVFGGRSIAYLQRQLLTDTTHSFLVIEPSLEAILHAAAALTPPFARRISFLRCESMFACLEVLRPESVDVAVVPMPVPFWSKQSSYRRLVHFDFLCAVHRVLRIREAPTDPRGLVLFTDCEPYAAFIMEHLEEAKLVVPFTRKNPMQLYQRWLPQDALVMEGAGGGDAVRPQREFTQQREEEVVALAAAKGGPTAPETCRLLASYNYARKYHRDLAT